MRNKDNEKILKQNTCRTIVNIPNVTKIFRSFDGTTNSWLKHPHIESGILETSQQQQQHFS